jgi:hypothetical protein
MNPVVRYVFVTLATFIFLLNTANAQQMTTGAIHGIVFDQSGAVVAGVNVKLRHVDTGLVRELITDASGRFSSALLPVGRYDIEASLAGFETNHQEGQTLTLGQTLELRLIITIANIQSSVAVASEPPSVDVARTGPGTLVSQLLVANLPLNGRRFSDLALMTPTASIDPERGQISFSGQRSINSSFNIDGADFNQRFFGGQTGGERSSDAYVVSQEAVQEFQVLRSAFSPEFGRSTGGIVNVITKSGTNAFHGSAFYYVRHRELAMKTVFGDVVAPIRQQFGGSVGGPIQKNRTFFFTAYDGQQQRQPLIIRFSSTTGLPQSFLDAQGVYESTNDVDTYLIKIDHQLASHTRLSGRYNFSRNIALNGTFTGNTTGALANNGTERDRTHSAVLNAYSVFSPVLVNELRFQYGREDRPRINNGEQADFVSKAGPQTQISGCCFFGGVSSLPAPEYDTKLQLSDSISLVRRSHTFKAGVEFDRNFINQAFRGNWRGVYIFNTLQTFIDVYGKVPGAVPDSFRIFFGDGKFKTAQREYSAFFQDTWTIVPRLTLTGGLRWGGVDNPQPIAPNVALPKTTKIPNDLSQWQPRLGLNFDLFGDGTTLLRAAGGTTTAATPMLLLNQAFTSNGNLDVGASFSLTASQIKTVQNAHPEFVWPFVPDTSKASNAAYFTGAGLSSAKPDASFFASDFRSPRSYNFTAGIDRNILGSVVVALEWNHSNTVNLERIRDVNQFAPVLGLDSSSPQQLRPIYSSTRPNASYNALRQQESSAHARYDGFSLLARQRSRRGYEFQGSYTLGYSRSDDDNERNFSGITYADGFNLAQEYQWSRNDVRHKFVGSATGNLPWGFLVSGIMNYRTGLPFSAVTNVDSNKDGLFTDRPIINGVPMLRNSFRQPNFFNVDMRASWSRKISESQRVELLFDFFNVLNHRNNFYSASTNESSTTALGARWGTGQTPLSTFRTFRKPDGSLNQGAMTVSTPFQAQVGLKYRF